VAAAAVPMGSTAEVSTAAAAPATSPVWEVAPTAELGTEASPETSPVRVVASHATKASPATEESDAGATFLRSLAHHSMPPTDSA
jgi:hypothetical protein